MTKDELVVQIQDEISASGAIPFAPPKKEIERIIDLEMRKLVREYRTLLRDRIYVLNRKLFQTKEFRQSRQIQFPSCVISIKEVVESAQGARVFGINDPDLNFDRLMASDLYLTPLSSDQITYRTIQWSFWDLARNFNLKDINHHWNMNTHRLTITGRNPQETMMVLAMEKIPDEDAFEDPIVIQWMIAKSKLSISRILGTFDFKLIGNTTINVDSIRSEGKDELDEAKEKIKGDDTCDWFVMFN
ncbi:MAG: hypothetical protein ACOCZ5_00930 [bacterium]